jgi:CRISPR-associated endoribonuclease Cas6
VTLLDDSLWEPLWTGVQSVAALDFNGETWPVRWPDAHIVHQDYEHLLLDIRPAPYLAVAFVSPTVFRAGEIDLPLPEPGAVFQSWLSRWNDFAPPNRRIDTALCDVIRSQVAISRIEELNTRPHDLGPGNRPIGFVGKVTYVVTQARDLNQAHIWQIKALADYAPFCGTGRKTTLGMGQTRRLHD